MNEIRISIILPSYNSEKHIQKAIDSFLAQDYGNKELIIVDGKSTDSTHDIIQRYASENDSIKWIKEKDFNVTDAINIGLKHCTGDFYAFLAADVFYYSNDIFSTIARNYAMVPFDGIYFDYYCYYPKNKTMDLLKCPNVKFDQYNLITYGTIAGFDNIFISKEMYKDQKYDPDYNLCSDWEFFLRITANNPLFIYVEKVCTINVQDGNNLTLKYLELQREQIQNVAKLYNKGNVVPFFKKNERSGLSKSVDLLKRGVKKVVRLVYK